MSTYYGLLRQRGPFRETKQDLKHVFEKDKDWMGGGVPVGGTAHIGHAFWESTMNPAQKAPAFYTLPSGERIVGRLPRFIEHKSNKYGNIISTSVGTLKRDQTANELIPDNNGGRMHNGKIQVRDIFYDAANTFSDEVVQMDLEIPALGNVAANQFLPLQSADELSRQEVLPPATLEKKVKRIGERLEKAGEFSDKRGKIMTDLEMDEFTDRHGKLLPQWEFNEHGLIVPKTMIELEPTIPSHPPLDNFAPPAYTEFDNPGGVPPSENFGGANDVTTVLTPANNAQGSITKKPSLRPLPTVTDPHATITPPIGEIFKGTIGNDQAINNNEKTNKMAQIIAADPYTLPTTRSDTVIVDNRPKRVPRPKPYNSSTRITGKRATETFEELQEERRPSLTEIEIERKRMATKTLGGELKSTRTGIKITNPGTFHPETIVRFKPKPAAKPRDQTAIEGAALPLLRAKRKGSELQSTPKVTRVGKKPASLAKSLNKGKAPVRKSTRTKK
jgi:hypothetical protein